MNRVNYILNSKKYKEYLNKINECERDRKFCRHNIEHFLDTARVAYIMVLEQNLNYSKEIIYAIALLHDIGRWKQYKHGISHEEASAELSKDILKESGFDKEEIELIINAILNHRNNNKNQFFNIIYKSDKLSRKCFVCNALKECNWSDEKKNFKINY